MRSVDQGLAGTTREDSTAATHMQRKRGTKVIDAFVPLPPAGGIDRQIGTNGRQRDGHHPVRVDGCLRAFEHFDRLDA